MRPKLLLLASLSLLFSICLFAQKKKKGDIPNRVTCTFGDVKPEDFAPTAYAVDSAAEAVYLFDGGRSDIEGSQHLGTEVVYKIHRRIRILKKNAFYLASVSIPLYVTSDFQQQVEDIKAATYNLSGNSVITSAVNKSDIFQEKRDSKFNVVKFTFPSVSEGSIIEYSYTIHTPGANNMDGWAFQKEFPVLWSEYEITYPLIYDYVLLKQGYQPYVIDTVKITTGSYLINQERGDGISRLSEQLTVSSKVADCIWAMKDVPPLKVEPFTTTLENHIAKIDFQLSSIQYSEVDIIHYLRTWSGVSDTLLKNDYYYGKAYVMANGSLDDDLHEAVATISDKFDKAKNIYQWVRDHYSCTGKKAWMEQPLRKIVQSRKGSSAEINLVLTVMLNRAGFEAHPVLLSTTDHGKAYKDYPILDKYNNTICELTIDGNTYLLDASDNKLGFNHLDPDCYNGYARVIDPEKPLLINLSPDSLKEGSVTSVFMANADNNKLVATVTNTKGYEESLSLRGDLAKNGKDSYFKTIKKDYTDNIEVSNGNIDSLQLLDMPVKVTYDLTIANNDDDIIYFNPMLGEQQKENPFKAAERYYPVEMPYCSDDTYVLNMEIPKGYEVDEIPKSARVKLNEDEGMFEYIIAKAGDRIQLRARVKLEKATYEPDDYQTLRDFFAFVVKKEAEEIVFKKIK